MIAAEPALWANVLGGGDDYELAIAVPPRKQAALLGRSAVGQGEGDRDRRLRAAARGVELTVAGRPVRAPRKG